MVLGKLSYIFLQFLVRKARCIAVTIVRFKTMQKSVLYPMDSR